MAYEAIICKASIKAHPNADRLKLVMLNGYQVVSGADIKEGDLLCYFNADGQLSEEFVFENSEYREGKGINKDPMKFGLFDSNRRVKSIKLRSEVSEGYCVPLTCLSWTGYDVSKFKEGDTFTELNGKLVCEKYYSPATREYIKGANNPKDKSHRFELPDFPLHYDTAQLRNYINRIPVGAVIHFSLKVHGTSGRTTKQLVAQQLPNWQVKFNSAIDWLSKYQPIRNVIKSYKLSDNQPMLVSGTRNTTLNPFRPYKDSYRKTAEDLFHGLRLGETAYYEIAGYSDGGNPLFSHGIEDKELKKKYGPRMLYTYGVEKGKQRIFIYRMTQQITGCGEPIELSFDQVERRANQLGIDTVLELREPMIFSDKESLMAEVARLSDGPDLIDPSHVREGLVLRVEHPNIPVAHRALKSKGKTFTMLESGSKDDDSAVDLEEIS